MCLRTQANADPCQDSRGSLEEQHVAPCLRDLEQKIRKRSEKGPTGKMTIGQQLRECDLNESEQPNYGTIS